MRTGVWINEQGNTEFRVWAPRPREIRLTDAAGKILSPLNEEKSGYLYAQLPGNQTGLKYFYQVDGLNTPDPASCFQPEGVHGPSQIVDTTYPWTDQDWQIPSLKDQVFYELHPGTFTAQADLESIIPRLPYLQELGITTLELMPLAQFPGARNWGYDGVYPYAVQNSYGGPRALQQLVNACHNTGLAVVLDVVYNHLGPEGNYLSRFGPYFTDRYHTPWGPAVNLDGPGSDPVREYLLQNALHWIRDFHIDGLRLDAVHAIFDFSARHILTELSDTVAAYNQTSGCEHFLIAESDLNDPKIIQNPPAGYGIQAQWLDGWHHCVHTLLTGEDKGYYSDFGDIRQLEKSYNRNYVFDGIYSPHRDRRFGADGSDINGDHFVIFTQNHDHIGNRPFGERLSTLAGFEAAKLAAGAMILSPFIPLIFMGEEFMSDTPFLYFVDHGDTDLLQAIREGRKQEFAGIMSDHSPPDPDLFSTWQTSVLDWEIIHKPQHDTMLRWYKTLLALRRSWPQEIWCSHDHFQARTVDESAGLCLLHTMKNRRLLAFLNFSKTSFETACHEPGDWILILDSSSPEWLGSELLQSHSWDGISPLIIPGFSLAIYEEKGYNQV